jgi:putative photosynthetic complex assembly protein
MTTRDAEAFKPIPRTILFAATALALGSIAVVALSRSTEVGVSRVAYANATETRGLVFADRADGAVSVSSAEDGSLVAVLEPGSSGFVRIVMRALAKERQDRGIGAAPAFELTRWDDGRLSITDPATGRRLDLTGFGKTNVDDFAKLLLARRASS